MSEVCKWAKDYDEGYNLWATSCKNLIELVDGTSPENKIKFCCYCGKKIMELQSREAIAKDEAKVYR